MFVSHSTQGWSGGREELNATLESHFHH
jgi:hypothetical protein